MFGALFKFNITEYKTRVQTRINLLCTVVWTRGLRRRQFASIVFYKNILYKNNAFQTIQVVFNFPLQKRNILFEYKGLLKQVNTHSNISFIMINIS